MPALVDADSSPLFREAAPGRRRAHESRHFVGPIREPRAYSGILSCFFHGLVSCFLCRLFSARTMRLRVSLGMITSSI